MLRIHKADKNMELGTIVVAALVGGVAGAVVGLLLAPKCGKDLRQGIGNKADNALERVEDVTTQHVGALKQQGTDLVEKGKILAEDLQTFIQDSLRNKKSGDIPINLANDTKEEASDIT
ncbi:hypothetical protein UF75_2261 [Desulfosporosinus sp. I2]|uniref:YtxH domain-containing protein n=1 Tax=Desulfosporosinus sp. I2 TaxID=1617025 RepID=UPI0005F0664A|nr:YtxH domain-containing protein [Desulfosporosinus sp. I2]KJR47348.1 hypothetical protein UF75_2261 [Desulfosporosinus sp. I2]